MIKFLFSAALVLAPVTAKAGQDKAWVDRIMACEMIKSAEVIIYRFEHTGQYEAMKPWLIKLAEAKVRCAQP
jgi:hypothetical protein